MRSTNTGSLVRRTGCILSMLSLLVTVSASGQYKIDWYTIDGGGGTSSGGPYTLSGTMGQPDADWCAGGPYELLGGFWPGGPISVGDCLPACHKDYAAWVAAGKPACWCYLRQCHGDADGDKQGSDKTGHHYVGTNDLNVLISAWMVKEPPHGPGIASVPDGICADFDHKAQCSDKTGMMRVGTDDLNILIANWLKKEPPQGQGIPADCLDCP